MDDDMTLLDLFCGAGGLALGFEKAGFKVVGAFDIEESAVATYQVNVDSSVKKLDLSDRFSFPKVTVIAGGPPCQGFSSAGRREVGDKRNSLVSHFANIVAELRPQAFVFENVEGFLTAEEGGRILELLTPLVIAGYRIHLRKINAANYGVPQHRKRVIAIGGLGWDPTFPQPTHTAFGAPGALLASRLLPLTPTFEEALRDLPPALTIPPGHPPGHFYRPLSEEELKRAKALRIGMTMRDLPEELRHNSYTKRANRRVMDGTPTERRGGAPTGIRRIHPHEPAKTITSGARSEFFHPYENRTLTIRECARLQTFPDDFVFVGNLSEQALLIGNAVPPKLAYVIASTLAEDLRNKKSTLGKGALLSFVPTLSDGSSPVLKKITSLIVEKFVPSILGEDLKAMKLSRTQEAFITKLRVPGGELGVGLDDEVFCYLLSIIIHDLNISDKFPEIPEKLPPFFGKQSLSSLKISGLNFRSLFEKVVAMREDADAYFYCLATLHKARLKYERILQAQPIPTIDQVGPRGLLQYGSLSPRALIGLLLWRKWIFDIDNRAAQETGYVFEPIIAHAIGGVPFSAKKSPVKRGGNGTGRQVDCLRTEDKQAYEIKLRVTIAASGQGRWQEELDFPADARASGYKPILVVLDPTPNPKLEELCRAFRVQDGDVYVGQNAWAHLEKEAGATMATFIEKYVRMSLQSLLNEVPEVLPDFSLSITSNQLTMTIGDEQVKINRNPREQLATEVDQLPLDIDEHIPSFE